MSKYPNRQGYISEVIMMKCKLYLITLLLIVMVIADCAGSTNNEVITADPTNTETEVMDKEEPEQGIETEEKPTEDKEKPIEVDKGLFSVNVTLPASIFQGENMDDVIAKAKEDG